MVLHFLPCQLLWAKYCLGCHHANNLPGAAVFLPAGFFFQSRGNYYLIKLHPYFTGDYELFDENKCCGHGSVSMSWILTFLSSLSSWGVRVPPELLPLLLQLEVTKWPTTIDQQKNKHKVIKSKQQAHIKREQSKQAGQNDQIRNTLSLGWEDPVVFGFVEKEMEVMGHLILNKKLICMIWTRRYNFALWSFYHQPDLPFHDQSYLKYVCTFE